MYDLASQPSRDQADYEYDQKSFTRHDALAHVPTVAAESHGGIAVVFANSGEIGQSRELLRSGR